MSVDSLLENDVSDESFYQIQDVDEQRKIDGSKPQGMKRNIKLM